MDHTLSALVVNDDANLLQQLRNVLETQHVTTRCACTCEEAKAVLSLEEHPDIIFAGTSFADGTWRDLLKLAHQISPGAGVVITTRLADVRLYLDAMDEGAADYIVPPFAASDVAHVVRSTLQDVSRPALQARARGAA